MKMQQRLINTILPQIILFLTRTWLSFLIGLAFMKLISFLINLELRKLMCLNVYMGDNAIFQ
jgi:hypothetical protein